MNRIYLKVTKQIILIVPLIGQIGISDLHAIEFNVAEHKLFLEIAHLEKPETWGIALKSNPTKGDEDIDLSVKLDVLLAREPSLNEKANLNVSYNLTWRCPGEWIDSPGGLPGQRRFYRGLFGMELGLESAPKKHSDGNPGDWRVADWNTGPVFEHQIPYSRVILPWCKQGSWPLIIGGSIKYINEIKDKNEYWRGYFFIDWEVAIFSTTTISGFVGGRYEGYIIDDGAEHYYREVRAQLSIPGLHIKYFGDPIIFTKYINGEQPPEYDDRDEWDIGIGTELIW